MAQEQGEVSSLSASAEIAFATGVVWSLGEQLGGSDHSAEDTLIAAAERRTGEMAAAAAHRLGLYYLSIGVQAKGRHFLTLAASSGSPEHGPAGALALGQDFINAGQEEAAVPFLETAAASGHPEWGAVAAALRAQTLTIAGRLDEALPFVNIAVNTSHPIAGPSTAIRYAAALIQKQRPDEALEFLKVAARDGDASTRERALFLEALVLAGQGRSESAARLLAEAASGADPPTVEAAQRVLGEVLLKATRTGAAMERLINDAAPDATADAQRELGVALTRQFGRLLQRQPEGAGHPLDTSILLQVIVEVEDAIAALGIELPDRPRVISAPTGDVNALTFTEDADGQPRRIIAVEDGTYTFFHLVAKAVMRGLYELRPERVDVAPSLVLLDPAAELFAEAVKCYMVDGDPRYAPLRPAPPQLAHSSIVLVNLMERFLVAHEYGHVLERHPANESSDWTMQEELAADVWALRILTADDSHDALLALVGSQCAVHCLSLSEQLGRVLTHSGQARIVKRHPAGHVRREYLLGWLLSQGLAEAEAAVRCTQLIDVVFAHFWEIASDRIRGMQLAQRWSAQ